MAPSRTRRAQVAGASRAQRGRLAKGEGPSGASEAPPWCPSRPGELRPLAASRFREPRQLFAHSRQSCSKSEHEKREWEHKRWRVGTGERRVGRQAASRLNGNSGRWYGSAADFARNIAADFVARLGLTALLAPTTALGSRPAPETPSGRRPARRGRAASMQNTLSEGTARAAQLAPSAVTAGAVGGSATRRE